jgi:DNA-binding transcriptional ArsR family regulator
MANQGVLPHLTIPEFADSSYIEIRAHLSPTSIGTWKAYLIESRVQGEWVRMKKDVDLTQYLDEGLVEIPNPYWTNTWPEHVYHRIIDPILVMLKNVLVPVTKEVEVTVTHIDTAVPFMNDIAISVEQLEKLDKKLMYKGMSSAHLVSECELRTAFGKIHLFAYLELLVDGPIPDGDLEQDLTRDLAGA